MPGKKCDKIKDPQERADCKAYGGKYAMKKSNPKPKAKVGY